jgi:glycosyltransferase involved in cell wall biosynthesis
MQTNDIITGRDIVVVGLQPWYTSIGSNCKDIALEFSEHNRVLYVNYALDRNRLLKNKDDKDIAKSLAVIKGKENGLIKIKENLWNLYPDSIAESINMLPDNFIFTFFNKINNKRFAKSIQKGIDALGFKNIILFNDNDIMRSFYLKDLLKPEISIYYIRDYLMGVDYWRKHGLKLEPALIAKSDVCVANSLHLADYCKPYNSRSYYVGQGCDLDTFMNVEQAIPVDIADIHYPRMGYVGALQSLRLNLDIIEYIAAKQPSWNIVLVGPEDDVFKASNLHNYSNIYFLGPKPPATLPAYINSFDVCLNPQVVNEVTIGNYPRKIDEYLAVGKPVVATSTDFMIAVFNNHTYLASSKEAYITAIQQALNDDSVELQQSRKAFAATHSWENNVKEIYKVINTFFESDSK